MEVKLIGERFIHKNGKTKSTREWGKNIKYRETDNTKEKTASKEKNNLK